MTAYGDTVSVALFVTPPALAEMLAVDETLTVPAVTLNEALTAPPGTVNAAGTVATAVLLVVRVTEVPPGAAGAFRVTVATEVPPLWMALGVRAIALTAGVTVTVSVADRVIVPALTEILGDLSAVTA